MKKTLATVFTLFTFSASIWCQEQKIPVSPKNFNDDSTTFRIAIVSDRTGGMREDVFAEAIEKLNLMQPEFVISVGDLIDGYTKDPQIWNKQWDEFDSMISKLDMPFYYVPGNHDSSNELMITAWHERHGRDYYHFLYKNVLFIAINTDELKNGGISQKQVDYIKKSLNENQDVQQTLIFMHRPLWSYGDQAGYEAIEKALKGRNYTLFSGHHHNYQYQVKNGMDHYVLGTTGGGSWMRGPEVGEFDHISWLTIKNKELKLAHINLNGIYDKNIVPPEDYDDIEVLRRGEWLEVLPVVSDDDTFTFVKVKMLVKNNMQRPMTISGELPVKDDFLFEPHSISEKLDPGQEQIIPIIIRNKSGNTIKIEDINNDPIDIELKSGFEREERKDISLSTSKRLFIDWKHKLNKSSETITIDGRLNDWSTDNFISVKNPQYLNEGWDWKGADDGQFSFAAKMDEKRLYIAVIFKDELFLSDTKNLEALQDKFYVQIASEPTANKDYFKLEFAKGDQSDAPLMNEAARNLKGVKAGITKNAEAMQLEFSVPLKSIHAEKTKSLRINIGVMDHDRPENTKPSVLWWRPVWDSDAEYSESSIFYKK